MIARAIWFVTRLLVVLLTGSMLGNAFWQRPKDRLIAVLTGLVFVGFVATLASMGALSL